MRIINWITRHRFLAIGAVLAVALAVHLRGVSVVPKETKALISQTADGVSFVNRIPNDPQLREVAENRTPEQVAKDKAFIEKMTKRSAVPVKNPFLSMPSPQAQGSTTQDHK